jgi:hypothetical protein
MAVAASWSFTENCHACTAIMLGAYISNARSTPQQPGHCEDNYGNPLVGIGVVKE